MLTDVDPDTVELPQPVNPLGVEPTGLVAEVPSSTSVSQLSLESRCPSPVLHVSDVVEFNSFDCDSDSSETHEDADARERDAHEERKTWRRMKLLDNWVTQIDIAEEAAKYLERAERLEEELSEVKKEMQQLVDERDRRTVRKLEKNRQKAESENFWVHVCDEKWMAQVIQGKKDKKFFARAIGCVGKWLFLKAKKR